MIWIAFELRFEWAFGIEVSNIGVRIRILWVENIRKDPGCGRCGTRRRRCTGRAGGGGKGAWPGCVLKPRGVGNEGSSFSVGPWHQRVRRPGLGIGKKFGLCFFCSLRRGPNPPPRGPQITAQGSKPCTGPNKRRVTRLRFQPGRGGGERQVGSGGGCDSRIRVEVSKIRGPTNSDLGIFFQHSAGVPQARGNTPSAPPPPHTTHYPPSFRGSSDLRRKPVLDGEEERRAALLGRRRGRRPLGDMVGGGGEGVGERLINREFELEWRLQFWFVRFKREANSKSQSGTEISIPKDGENNQTELESQKGNNHPECRINMRCWILEKPWCKNIKF